MAISFYSHLNSNPLFAVLSWHVKIFVGIWELGIELQQNKFFVDFELFMKIAGDMSPGIGDEALAIQ